MRSGYELTPPRIGAELGVDPKTILATSHGRRSIDTLQLYDPAKANWECKCQTSDTHGMATLLTSLVDKMSATSRDSSPKSTALTLLKFPARGPSLLPSKRAAQPGAL
jgi:hypothetical protein